MGQKVQMSGKTGHFGHLNSTNFRPFKIGKGWIASGFRSRKDDSHFRPNVLLKDTQNGRENIEEKIK